MLFRANDLLNSTCICVPTTKAKKKCSRPCIKINTKRESRKNHEKRESGLIKYVFLNSIMSNIFSVVSGFCSNI